MGFWVARLLYAIFTRDFRSRSDLAFAGDGDAEEERDELIEFAEEGNEAQKRRVIDTLRAAREIVAVQVLFGNGDTVWTLDRLSPLWTWLQSNRRGLVQADGEGYYEGDDLVSG